MEFEFKDITIKERDIIQKIYDENPSRDCDNCFANNFLWGKIKSSRFCIYKHTYFTKNIQEGEEVFSFPVGKEEEVKEIINSLIVNLNRENKALKFFNVNKKEIDFLGKNYKGRFVVRENRDRADYVYLREKLSSLSGKKLHSKRNHVNKFNLLYKDYYFEKIDEINIAECEDMLDKWAAEQNVEEDKEKLLEVEVVHDALRYFKDLKLEGLLLKVDSKVIAFSIGEKISNDTYCVHFEKALTEYEGAYTKINQLFVQNIISDDIIYVNREEDVGSLGLRKAKLSYHPEIMITKDDVEFID